MFLLVKQAGPPPPTIGAMLRQRFFATLDECVNPIYQPEWGDPVTVRDAVDFAWNNAVQSAYRKITKHGHVRLMIPDVRVGPHLIHYLQSQCHFGDANIQVLVGDVQQYRHDILLKFVPMTRHCPPYAIPYCWNDNEPDWKWQDVLDHGNYSSSSSQIGPPPDYLRKAQEEKQRQQLTPLLHTNPSLSLSN